MPPRLLCLTALGVCLASTPLTAQTPAGGSSTSPPPAAPSSTVVKTDTSFTVVILQPTPGDLPLLLKAEVTKAVALHRTPFVELGASWCGPCHHLENSLGDKRMIKAFAGTYIIRLDVDAWQEQLAAVPTFQQRDGIPAIFAVDTVGFPTGKRITGSAWDDDIPQNMAPPLRRFFRANQWKW